MKRFDPVAGPTIEQAAEQLVAHANEVGENVVGDFNDIDVIARPGDDPQSLVDFYRKKFRGE